jgi:hypothetical protein
MLCTIMKLNMSPVCDHDVSDVHLIGNLCMQVLGF